MKGRNVLSEYTGSSICAFCAHRLQASRHRSYIQLRFLQSSHPAAKPPATATAACEYTDESVAHNVQSSPTSANKWPMGRTGPSVGFGRPAFHRGTVPSLNKESSVRITSSSGNSTIELTEEERRARELVSKTAEKAENKPRRLFDVFPSPGPEWNRAGRPIPAELPKGWSPKLENDRRLKALENHHRIKAIDQEKEPAESSEFRREASRPVSNWGHLRRRNNDAMNNSFSTPDNHFSQSQTQLGNPTKTSQYVPLKSNWVPRGRAESLWGENGQQSSPPMPHPTRKSQLAINNEASGGVAHGAVGNQMVQWQALSRRTPQTPGNMKSASETDQVDYYNPSRRNHLATSTFIPEGKERKADSTFIQEQGPNGGRIGSTNMHRKERVPHFQRSEVMAKGKGHDRLRRRNQLIGKDEDGEEAAAAARAERKRERKREKAAKKAIAPTPIFLPEFITVANLATALRVRAEDFLRKMEELGFEQIGFDHIFNGETAGLIAMEYNFEPFIDRGESEDLKARPIPTDQLALSSRPPIVTIMGHVDHGKTTLLDFLRKSSVAATEHGGITQHIGAFSVRMPSGKLVTFLDTPGHAAFLTMRQRGATVTDIVILVVAADDSVKPQTIEAINHAKAAKVPIIVAINKIDKKEINVEQVKQDLARYGVEIEDFGGDTQVVCVSGKTGQGMDQLDEAVMTLSEMLDFRAERDGHAEGWVLEASVKSTGKVATVLVRRGTMRPGDLIVAGTTWARIRCLRNEAGTEIAEASPGTPVQIEGWKEQPVAGDEVLQAPDESKAKSVTGYRLERVERERMAEDMRAINETRRLEHEKREIQKKEKLLTNGRNVAPAKDELEDKTGPTEIGFIIKGDVSGSVEAIVESILPIGSAEVRSNILRSGVGQLSEFDVEHAAAAKGYLVNFNTEIDPKVSQLAKTARVKILDHNVIYKLVDDVKATLSEYLKPLVTQRVLGEAEVSQVFNITIKGRKEKPIAGCRVKNGNIAKNSKIRVLRDGENIFDGQLASLKNVKKDVMEMRKGSECGMGFEGWEDFQVGDQIQSYEVKEEKRFL